MTLTVACHQLSFSSKKDENRNTIVQVLEESEAELDVFPEYDIGIPKTGLNKRFVQKNAEPLEGKFVSEILSRTEQKDSAAVFTTFLRENDTVYNAALLVETGKIKAIYRKIHLFDSFGYKESDFFAPGEELAIAELKGFRAGLAICFDLRFPELFRSMAYRGVDLFIVPSAWYKGEHKSEQWRILVMARAHENTAYLIAVNQTDPLFTGHSLVASPLANPIKEVGIGRISFSVKLDRKETAKAKESLPITRLTKPELYAHFNAHSRT